MKLVKHFFRITIFTKNETFRYLLDAENEREARKTALEITVARGADLNGATFNVEDLI